jgi:arylsulfatase
MIASATKELFTDFTPASRHAGRAAFITGQKPAHRSDQSRIARRAVGYTRGPNHADPLVGRYVTGQFGKNHLAINEYLPTVHGFDEFFGNLIT